LQDGIIYYIFKYFNISGKTLSEREADKLEKFVKELNLRGAEGRLANSGKYRVTSLCKRMFCKNVALLSKVVDEYY